MASPVASIVIPTFNRRERLSRVLSALSRQTVSPDTFEVVVVDDGSSDGTTEWLQAQRHAFQIQAHRQANSGPARARNAGVSAARGKYLVFIDDDVEPAPGLLHEHLRSHEGDRMRVVIGPLSSLPHYAQPWVAWEQAKLELQYAAMSRGDWQPTFRQFWTGNASLEREHVVAEGGFNVQLLRGEDIELGYRLHLRGLTFHFNAAAFGLHYAERSLASWMHAHESYGRMEADVFSRKGDEHAVMMLGENWQRLHPASRLLLKQTLGHPLRQAATKRAIRTWLEAEAAAGKPLLSSKLCSVLANLLYWQASFEAIGPRLAARVTSFQPSV